jgi:hypothetical protein
MKPMTRRSNGVHDQCRLNSLMAFEASDIDVACRKIIAEPYSRFIVADRASYSRSPTEEGQVRSHVCCCSTCFVPNAVAIGNDVERHKPGGHDERRLPHCVATGL